MENIVAFQQTTTFSRNEPQTRKGLWLEALGMPWYIYTSLLATASIVIGSSWDISWHLSIGRDSLFSPPHLLIYLGGVLGGLGGGYQMIYHSFFARKATRVATVWFWGFRSPLAALFSVWGALAMLTSAPFDDWWHNAYGLDVKILSPPHALLGIGMLVIQIGAMVQLAAFRNQQAKALDQTAHPVQQLRVKITSFMFAFTVGMLVAVLDGMFSAEFLRPNLGRSAIFYQVACLAFPWLLFAGGAISGLRYGATAAAFSYMSVLLCMYWIVPLFPAEPLLGPILQKNDHFFPYRFPLWLIVPAFCMDWLRAKMTLKPRWSLVISSGVAFWALLLGVQWWYSGIQLASDTNHAIFGGPVRGYFINPDWEYLYKFIERPGQTTTTLLTGLCLALGYAILSVALGSRFGKWMQRIQR
jgi:hypothetical protein